MERVKEESDKGIDLNAEPESELGSESESGVPCSICLDLVVYCEERSRAKLQCGHEFHLDCIGSAFNMKGTMQCPNCRKIEKGQWLYASASTNSPTELSMDDAGADSYPFYFGFTEMPYRVHICPFRGLPQVHPSRESSLGMMSTINPMVNHPHAGGSNPQPHGWLQFHHTPFQHHPLAAASGLPMPMPIPRFIPHSQAYDPNDGFSPYGETRMNYPHFPLQ